jgi:hypothetical protein
MQNAVYAELSCSGGFPELPPQPNPVSGSAASVNGGMTFFGENIMVLREYHDPPARDNLLRGSH